MSKENAPWYIIPADDKDTARLIAAKIILQTLEQHNFQELELPEKYRSHINEYKNVLENE